MDTKCVQCLCNYCTNKACPVYRETCTSCLAYDLEPICECPNYLGANYAEDTDVNKYQD